MDLRKIDVVPVQVLNEALMHEPHVLWSWELTVLRYIDEIIAGVYPDQHQAAVVAEVASRAKRALLFEELRRWYDRQKALESAFTPHLIQ